VEGSGSVGDFGQSHEWTADLKQHLDGFRLGHVIENVPVFFATLGADELWSQPRRLLSTEAPEIAVEPDAYLHRAIVLTPGCDIVRRTTPWVTVAPVYEASNRLDNGQRGNVRGGRTLHLVHITADWAADGFWVADLRLEMPIEKTALLSRTPLDAFTDEADYARLAERLGARRLRADVPNDVLDYVARPLFDGLRDGPDDGATLKQSVREIRLQLDDPLTPSRAVVFVVANNGEAPDSAGWT
jgi:hypothetical protein